MVAPFYFTKETLYNYYRHSITYIINLYSYIFCQYLSFSNNNIIIMGFKFFPYDVVIPLYPTIYNRKPTS